MVDFTDEFAVMMPNWQKCFEDEFGPMSQTKEANQSVTSPVLNMRLIVDQTPCELFVAPNGDISFVPSRR